MESTHWCSTSAMEGCAVSVLHQRMRKVAQQKKTTDRSRSCRNAVVVVGQVVGMLQLVSTHQQRQRGHVVSETQPNHQPNLNPNQPTNQQP
jgi:hypothetical protein